MTTEGLYDIRLLEGKTHVMHPQRCCGKCMAAMYTMCTMKISYVNHVIDDDTVAGINGKICGCIPFSPLPCCLCCGVGPCAAEFRFKRKPGTNIWVGAGCPLAGCPNACAGCDQCSHNNDEFTIDEQHDGSSAEKAIWFTPGGQSGNFFTPPCIAGPCSCCSNEGLFGITDQGIGKPAPRTMPAPVADMER